MKDSNPHHHPLLLPGNWTVFVRGKFIRANKNALTRLLSRFTELTKVPQTQNAIHSTACINVVRAGSDHSSYRSIRRPTSRCDRSVTMRNACSYVWAKIHVMSSSRSHHGGWVGGGSILNTRTVYVLFPGKQRNEYKTRNTSFRQFRFRSGKIITVLDGVAACLRGACFRSKQCFLLACLQHTLVPFVMIFSCQVYPFESM